MNIRRTSVLFVSSLFCFLTTTLSWGNLVSNSNQDHLSLVLTSTASTEEVAKKDAKRLKIEVVDSLLQNLGLKATVISTNTVSRLNVDNSYTYKVTMNGYVHSLQYPAKIITKIGHTTGGEHEKQNLKITNLSFSNITGTRHKYPYHDIEMLISSDAEK